jgi:hypothetical protein
VHGQERSPTKRFEESAALERLEGVEPMMRPSATSGKNHRQLFWRDDFELVISAVARLLVGAPPAKLRCVTEAVALHVIVSNFDN